MAVGPNAVMIMACSQCEGIERQFNSAEANRQLRRLRRRGPDRSTRLLIDVVRRALDEADVHDASLLDIGAGIGAIHHELLDGRVTRAVHVDASTAHVAAAREETERRGHGGRVEFVRNDFVAVESSVRSAEVVTLDRVICCYPDMDRLVGASARKAERFYGAVYPRAVPWTRIGVAAVNLVQRVRRSAFRVFVHDPARIDAVLRASGLERAVKRTTLGWEVVLYERSAPARAPAAAG